MSDDFLNDDILFQKGFPVQYRLKSYVLSPFDIDKARKENLLYFQAPPKFSTLETAEGFMAVFEPEPIHVKPICNHSVFSDVRRLGTTT
jgi:hypothetical protein